MCYWNNKLDWHGSLLIYRPLRDGWLSWPCWPTDSGRLNHKVVTRPASSLAQDRESLPTETSILTTMPGESSRPSGQPQQKPGGRTCWDGDAVRPEDVDWRNECTNSCWCLHCCCRELIGSAQVQVGSTEGQRNDHCLLHPTDSRRTQISCESEQFVLFFVYSVIWLYYCLFAE